MTRRLHLLDPDRPGGVFTGGTRRGQAYRISWCGRIGVEDDFDVADDVLEATCLLCLSRLERDADPDVIEPYLRTRAYSRALCILRDRHREEFDAIVEETLPAVLAEADR